MTILTRFYSAELRVRDEDAGDGRTLVGLCMPYDTEVRVRDAGGPPYYESFAPGCATDLTDPTRIALVVTHPRTAAELPIGVTTELSERDGGLWGAWRVSRVAAGDEVLALASDGVPLGLSVGFTPVRDRGSERAGRVRRLAVALDHVAVVRKPAYSSALVTAVRHDAGTQDASSVRLNLARIRAW